MQVTATFNGVQASRIVVDKVTDPSDATQVFQFALTGGPDTINRTFLLTDATTPYDSGDLKPGTYAFTETVPEGWSLTSATCDDGSPPSDIDLGQDETVTCTFSNKQTGPCEQLGISALASPPDGSNTTDWFPTFKWSSVAGATKYRIRLKYTGSATELLSKVTSETEYTHDAPLAPADYNWRVRALNDCDLGDWSESRLLTILPISLDYEAYLPLVTRGAQQR